MSDRHCFETGNTCLQNHFLRRGESQSFTKSASLYPIFSCEKHCFVAFMLLKMCQYMGYYIFFSIENCEGDSFVRPDSEKVALECMTSFAWNTFLPQRQADSLYDSFPNKSHSILACNHCISQCCLLRLAKKKINYFQQKPCCVLIRKETVEE